MTLLSSPVALSRISLFSLLLACAIGCRTSDKAYDDTGGSDSGNGSHAAPTVRSNSPLAGALDAPLNAAASATFSIAMDPDTLNTASFTLATADGAASVEGTVIYADGTAVFWPSEHLELDTA